MAGKESFHDATVVGDVCPVDGEGRFRRGGDIMVEAFDLNLVSQRDISAEGEGSVVVDAPAGVEETQVGVGGLS